jgi:EAL and modified HD-GYP domain-containing signal transduction protein
MVFAKSIRMSAFTQSPIGNQGEMCMDVYVARQPVFKTSKDRYGYELLFRDGLDNAFPDIDGDEATSRLLSNSFFSMGIERVTGTGTAFVNFTRDLLVKRVPMMFPPERVVVEILEDVEPEEEVVRACREIAEAGYTLALDDFCYRPEMAPLIEVSRIIKFDLRATPLETLPPVLEALSSKNLLWLAEKVETHEEFQAARDMGFRYFQGYFFSRPEVLVGKDVDSPQMHLLQIMAEANREDVAFGKLEKVIEQDVAISYKLLRYINSAYFRRLSNITSIRQAIVLLGEKGIRRFLSLVAMSSLNSEKPDELIRESMVRARFCEGIGVQGGFGKNPAELFTLGLFSLIDAIMDAPMASLMEPLPLSDAIKEALIHRNGKYGYILRLVEQYEHGDWAEVDALAGAVGLDPTLIPGCYVEALSMADQLQHQD